MIAEEVYTKERKDYGERPFRGKNPGGSEHEMEESFKRNRRNKESKRLGSQTNDIGSRDQNHAHDKDAAKRGTEGNGKRGLERESTPVEQGEDFAASIDN